MVRRILMLPTAVRPPIRIMVLLALLAACGPAQLRRTAEIASPIANAVAAAPPAALASRNAADVSQMSPMVLGVQTHFSQGWPASALALAQQVSAPMLRDALPWAAVEKVRGSYNLNSPAAQTLAAACKAGLAPSPAWPDLLL